MSDAKTPVDHATAEPVAAPAPGDEHLPPTQIPVSVRLAPGAGPWRRFNWALVALGVAAAAIGPWLMLQLDQRFLVTLFVSILVFGMVAQCWNLVLGVSGIFSLGQLVLYAIGGYASTLVAIHLGLTPFVAIWVGAAAAAVAAVVIGLPILRLRGIYVALLTLGFVELLRHYLGTGPELFGGFYGLVSPGFGFETWVGSGNKLLLSYELALALFVVTTYAVWRILYSPIGMAFTAMRDSEVYSVSRGVDPFRFKLLLFAYSAFFTGLAGAFMAHYQETITPSTLDFGLLVNLIMMIVIGGWATFWGPIVGAAILVLLDGYFLRELPPGWHGLVLGGLLATIVVVAPQGVVPLAGPRIKRFLASLFPEEDEEDEEEHGAARPDVEVESEEDEVGRVGR